MRNIQGVHHVAVSVPDIATARRFYLDLLGATEVSAVEWPAGNSFIDEIVGLKDCAGKSFMARLGNTYVEVFEYLEPRAAPQDPNQPVNTFGYTHFGLQVDDIHAVYDRMLAAGCTFHTPPRHSGGDLEKDGRRLGFLSTYGRDFFGNVFELIQIDQESAIAPL
ncbi:VOC family protein [Sphingomonas profundi]|uniref:VOC family protein n=1 Tax=Alterirhizorhabdus profundi TaxID=2681549 RepID=UPI0012E88022|nr:VOC family protein [Sphingomonas profundi]